MNSDTNFDMNSDTNSKISAGIGGSIGIASFLIILTLFTLFTLFTPIISSATKDVPPPIYGIEILEYDYSLNQKPGTTETYEVKIKNIGILSLRDVKLEAEKIPEDWFSSDATIDLEFGEVGALKYELTVPVGISGLYAFPLIARGSYGVGIVSDIKPVILNATILTEPKITTTTTTTEIKTAETTTTTTEPTTSTTAPTELQKPISVLEILNPEIVFSKFRAAVTRVRITIKAILTNEMLLYKTAAVLFIAMLILAGLSKAVNGW